MTNKCKVESCTSPVKYKGLCGKHYKRQWRHGSANITLIDMQKTECVVEYCTAPRRYSTGYCQAHHIRMLRYGRLHRIKAANGEGAINSAGYRLLTINNKRVYEHIFLAEKALGKPLPTGAVVHHMDNNPANNYEPFNLVICPDQDYHLLLHRRALALQNVTPEDLGI